MKKIDRILLKVFLYELPLVILYAAAVGIFSLDEAALHNVYARFFYDFGGMVVFGSWMLVSLCLSARLVASAAFREQVLSRIARLRERDEREFMLTGKAARNTMLTTLAVLILLFCLSCFQVAVYRVPADQATDGKDKVLTLNFQFDLLNELPRTNRFNDADKTDIVAYTGLPVSNSTLILGLIVWQLASYHRLINKELK